MTKAPCRNLGIAGLGLPMELKRALIRQLTKHQAGLFNLRFYDNERLSAVEEQTSMLRGGDANAPSQQEYNVGQCCTYEFFILHHLSARISKGPFSTSAGWLTASLNAFIREED